MATRRYQQRARAETAEETRRAILDAVYQRLREAPSEKVSVEQIARMAGVARSTVYVIFGSRAGLFDALGADLMQRAGFERIVAAVALPDALDQLHDGLVATVDVYAANRDVARALYSMALPDPDAVGGAIHRIEENRAGGMAHLAQQLADQGVLRPGVTAAEAADILWVLYSFDTFDLLYTGRGLSTDQVAQRLLATVHRTLCRAPAVAPALQPPGEL